MSGAIPGGRTEDAEPVVDFDELEVLALRSDSGPAGASAAFMELERRLPSLRGRRFYGLYHRGTYHACATARPSDDAEALELVRTVVPGGRYARASLQGSYGEIGPTFCSMAERHREDPDRPTIEFYREWNEVLLYLPVAE